MGTTIPSVYEVETVNQKLEVTVMEVDLARKWIGLSMKSDPFAERKPGSGGRKDRKPREEKEPEGDLAAKLALLKGKFR